MDECFSRDLTQLAADGRLGPFCGRDKIIDQAIAVLSQDGKANLVFTGEPGVGKTAVVEALAQRLSQAALLLNFDLSISKNSIQMR